MSDNPFIEIDAPSLCVLECESAVRSNNRVYGKSLAEYLQSKLPVIGYRVPWIECEDWGWYVTAEIDGFQMAVCVYGLPSQNDESANSDSAKQAEPHDPDSTSVRDSAAAGTLLSLCVTVGTQPRKYWDWGRFRRVDRSGTVAKLSRDLLSIFETDSEITVVGCTDEFPLG